jgi:glycosyltransferase involved in cell wall biosynthesis
MAPRVEILLATYNGARYLPAQLDSLIAQTLPPARVLARDDGSTDATLAMLDGYRDRLPLRRLAGGHLGVRRAFFALLGAVAADSDYAAFADQDDVWLPAKLERAVAALAALPAGRPGLYCARAILTDRDLRPIGHTRLPRRPAGFANALVENIASGNTILLNRAAIDLLNREHPAAAVDPIHDWWSYQVIGGCGTVVYDPEPALHYRQHGGNTIGVNANPLTALRERVARQLSGRDRGVIRAQAAELRRLFADRLTAGAGAAGRFPAPPSRLRRACRLHATNRPVPSDRPGRSGFPPALCPGTHMMGLLPPWPAFASRRPTMTERLRR